MPEREEALRNLLAVIHRDGGHYAAAHGDTKAAKDAEQIVVNLRAALAEVRGELEQCRAQVKALVKTLARAEQRWQEARAALAELRQALTAVVERAEKTTGAWHPHGPTIERCRQALARAEGPGWQG
jgi:chromosome segregation ATPase